MRRRSNSNGSSGNNHERMRLTRLKVVTPSCLPEWFEISGDMVSVFAKLELRRQFTKESVLVGAR